MQYTAIIKDGGLFIPNVFSDLNDGGSHIVQVEVDIAEVRQQLGVDEASKTTVAKKSVAKAAKKPSLFVTKLECRRQFRKLEARLRHLRATPATVDGDGILKQRQFQIQRMKLPFSFPRSGSTAPMLSPLLPSFISR